MFVTSILPILRRTLRDYQKAYVDCVLSIEKKNKEELFSMSNREKTLKRRGFVSQFRCRISMLFNYCYWSRIVYRVRFRTKNNSVLLQQNADITDHMSSVSRQLAEVIKQSTGALETLGNEKLEHLLK